MQYRGLCYRLLEMQYTWGMTLVLRCSPVDCDTNFEMQYNGCDDMDFRMQYNWSVKQVLRCNAIGCDTVGFETGFEMQ